MAGHHNHQPCIHGLHPRTPPEPVRSARREFVVPGPGTHDPNPRVLSTSRVYLAQGSEAHVPAVLKGAKMGLDSEALRFEDTYFSPLYVHSLFGHLSPWGSTASPLPPINSVASYAIPPEDRRDTRLSWNQHNFGRPPQPGCVASRHLLCLRLPY